jgi:multidrug resistance protein, MATE family
VTVAVTSTMAPAPAGRMASLRRIAPLAWPVFIGQVAVLAFGTVDTMLVARRSAEDVAGLAVGGAAYITVFVGLMGVVLAIGPIAGQLFGARKLAEAGRQFVQALWLALGLSLIGSLVLLFPAPFLALAHADADVADKARGYLSALAVALPAVLAFQAMRGFNLAVSRPKAVMLLQLSGLALKIPLTIALVPSLGVAGCGIATAIAMWLQLLAAVFVMRRDRFYAPFELKRRGPDIASQRALLRLGVPIGLSILIEVTGFSFMALFIARLGAVPVAGHQIAINIVSMMFMLPLAIANATSTLVAQQIGADDLRDARRVGWHGLQIGIGVSALLAGVVFVTRESVIGLYTSQTAIAAAALPLIAWLVLFHTADAAQTLSAFVLRAYRITVVPLVIYVSALWGVGLGGGTYLAFGAAGIDALRGARGYWAAATLGIVLAAVALVVFMAWTLRRSGSLRQRERVSTRIT